MSAKREASRNSSILLLIKRQPGATTCTFQHFLAQTVTFIVTWLGLVGAVATSCSPFVGVWRLFFLGKESRFPVLYPVCVDTFLVEVWLATVSCTFGWLWRICCQPRFFDRRGFQVFYCRPQSTDTLVAAESSCDCVWSLFSSNLLCLKRETD